VISLVIQGFIMLLGLAEVYAALFLFGMIMVALGGFIEAVIAIWRKP
jgi:hypothetical protein